MGQLADCLQVQDAPDFNNISHTRLCVTPRAVVTPSRLIDRRFWWALASLSLDYCDLPRSAIIRHAYASFLFQSLALFVFER